MTLRDCEQGPIAALDQKGGVAAGPITFSFACSSVRPTIAISGCVKHAAGMARWSTSFSLPMMFSTALKRRQEQSDAVGVRGLGLGLGVGLGIRMWSTSLFLHLRTVQATVKGAGREGNTQQATVKGATCAHTRDCRNWHQKTKSDDDDHNDDGANRYIRSS